MWTVWEMLSAALMAVPMCAKVEGPAQASHAHRTMLEKFLVTMSPSQVSLCRLIVSNPHPIK